MARTDFASGFERLVGFAPYAWQERLYRDFFAKGILPAAVDIPTGLGKTAVMALWLLARQDGTMLPRRLVYVVDRRVVVDQATEVADRLAEASGLAVSTLRGERADNRRWLEDPSAAAIIVGTVDMIGSRLLFEGYGVSRGMRPFHAGLLGADTLVLLDEAHLCAPFAGLLRTIAEANRLAPGALNPRQWVPKFHVVPLSATPLQATQQSFQLTDTDVDPVAQKPASERFNARKQLKLEDVKAGEPLEDWLAEAAKRLPKGRNLVFCDSRAKAQKIAEKLRKSKVPTELLTGARRVREREGIIPWLRQHGFMGTAAASGDTAYLVATSAGEVGADFDADNMCCDLVAFERMAQRLGRVNRCGGEGRAATVLVGCAAPAPKPKKGKQAKKATEEADGQDPPVSFLAQKSALEALPNFSDGSRSGSPAALRDLRAQRPQLVAAASTPEPRYPRLERAHVEAWAMTSLRDHPGRPYVWPWLRGWEAREPETAVLWRQWLPWRAGEAANAAEVEEFFETAPPHRIEILSTQTSRVAKWLVNRCKKFTGRQSPLSAVGAIVLSPALDFKTALTRGELERLGGSDKELISQLTGAILVVSADLGGLDVDGLLDDSYNSRPACWDNGWNESDLWACGVRLAAADDELSEEWRPIGEFSWGPDGGVRRVIAGLRDVQRDGEGDPAVSRRPQSLEEHTAWVTEEVGRIAANLRLPEPLCKALTWAARHHDLGKARKLWQDAMGAPVQGRPFGKTRGRGVPARLKIGTQTYRHEFGSLRDCESVEHENLPELYDLALHLIACHHGHARPIIAALDPEEAPSSPQSRRRAEETMLRFARLQEEWGPWGLAWIEAVFRAADQCASRRLESMAKPLGAGS